MKTGFLIKVTMLGSKLGSTLFRNTQYLKKQSTLPNKIVCDFYMALRALAVKMYQSPFFISSFNTLRSLL